MVPGERRRAEIAAQRHLTAVATPVAVFPVVAPPCVHIVRSHRPAVGKTEFDSDIRNEKRIIQKIGFEGHPRLPHCTYGRFGSRFGDKRGFRGVSGFGRQHRIPFRRIFRRKRCRRIGIHVLRYGILRCRRPLRPTARIRRSGSRLTHIVGIGFRGTLVRGGGEIAGRRLRPHGCRRAAEREKPPYTDGYTGFRHEASPGGVCGHPLPDRCGPPKRAYFRECGAPPRGPEDPGMRKPPLQDAANPPRRPRPRATSREEPARSAR